ncbi:uncharacterized protein B0H64DRAFT_58381 [Chaetomium fimeti]|uniref:Uncharacterized protein n=1 Tax=Chaetomium fimeti TaxID=1854472 RepID=A0AAE0H5V1_9PEZI|nr:hypothetical protein B0H64DRAFT_58381 [Chaetomium fimeti]
MPLRRTGRSTLLMVSGLTWKLTMRSTVTLKLDNSCPALPGSGRPPSRKSIFHEVHYLLSQTYRTTERRQYLAGAPGSDSLAFFMASSKVARQSEGDQKTHECWRRVGMGEKLRQATLELLNGLICTWSSRCRSCSR